MPSLVCETGKGLLEIATDEEKFANEISWNIQDMLGNTLTSNIGQLAGVGLSSIQQCVDIDLCYTFSLHNSFQDGLYQNSRYTVKLDGETLTTGVNSSKERTAIFGGICLGDGDATCTSHNASDTMSMFRLELAADSGSDVTWKMLNGMKEEILSAGPYGNCEVNTRAMCLPREDCFEFIISDSSEAGTIKGLFTVMFSHGNDMIQNYTGHIFSGVQQVFLGTCYGMGFSR
jgi:hypothetical protein